MKAFWQLLRIDLHALQFTMMLFGVITVVWDIFLFTRVGRWEEALPLGLSFIPLSFLPLWIVWDAIQSYRSEWNSGSIYLMLSLPTSGWKLALSKLVAAWISFTLLSVLALPGAWFILMRETGLAGEIMSVVQQVPRGYLLSAAFWLGLGYWLSGLAVAVMVQAAYVTSRLVRRGQFLVLLGALWASAYGLLRLGGLGHYLFAWVPDLQFKPLDIGLEQVRVAEEVLALDSGILLGWVLGLGLLYILTARLLQQVVEV
jgi:hypothetical protein